MDVDVPLNTTLDITELLDTRLVAIIDDVTVIGVVIMLTTVLVGAMNDVGLLSDVMGVCLTLIEVTDDVEVIVLLDIAVINVIVTAEVVVL